MSFEPEFPDPAFPGFPGPSVLDQQAGAVSAVPGLVGLVFAVVIIGFIVALVRGAASHARNAAAPAQTVVATVVSKRTQTTGGHNDTAARTRYFVTFEHPDGERLELPVDGREYGQLAEGDEGRLAHQGTWYRGFVRNRMPRIGEPREGPTWR